MKSKLKKLQWHPAFCSATELELREDKKNLTFIREHSLTKAPLKIDLMVILKKPGIRIKNEIGHIFKTHNIVEYKSPNDTLNIDDYFKSLAYVCLYKAQGKHVDEIPFEELSLTLVYDSKPIKLIDKLRKSGLEVTEKYKGIYYITGNPSIPNQQIVTTSELGSLHFLLKAISRKFETNDLLKLANFAENAKNQNDKFNLDSLLQVSFLANSKVYNVLRKENTMCEAFFDLFKDEIAAKIAAAENVVRAEAKEKEKKSAAKIKALEKEIAELKKKLAS